MENLMSTDYTMTDAEASEILARLAKIGQINLTNSSVHDSTVNRSTVHTVQKVVDAVEEISAVDKIPIELIASALGLCMIGCLKACNPLARAVLITKHLGILSDI
jgi:hypothetical protein